jgi:hypothetical protein
MISVDKKPLQNTTLVLWSRMDLYSFWVVLERYWIEMDCVLLDTMQKWFRVMSSEIGVLDIKPEDIHRTLEPGKCFG